MACLSASLRHTQQFRAPLRLRESLSGPRPQDCNPSIRSVRDPSEFLSSGPGATPAQGFLQGRVSTPVRWLAIRIAKSTAAALPTSKPLISVCVSAFHAASGKPRISRRESPRKPRAQPLRHLPPRAHDARHDREDKDRRDHPCGEGGFGAVGAAGHHGWTTISPTAHRITVATHPARIIASWRRRVIPNVRRRRDHRRRAPKLTADAA